MDRFLQDFLTDTAERLQALGTEIVRLEQAPDDAALLGRIFRLVHTIKGNCGFLSLPRLEKIAHHAENLLGSYRSGSAKPGQQAVTLILQTLDRIRDILAGITSEGREPPGDDTPLLQALDAALSAEAALPQTAPAAAAEEAFSNTLRVNVGTLEDIMGTVGELVLVRNEFMRLPEGDAQLQGPLQRFAQAMAKLQGGVMKARMQPVETLWAKLPRIVRDMGIDLGKKIRLETDGGGTEIDRQVMELVRDPLMHLVRNAAGHGLEKPAERVLAGKPPEGLIRIEAKQEGGQVLVEVADDGRGMEPAIIGAAAVSKGFLTQERLAALPQAEILGLVFLPGFSTARDVTALSGRGVGLDVVRSNIEKIGGHVDVSSTPGRGAAFQLRIPLTLAILPALIVGVEGQRYAIPRSLVMQAVRLKRGGDHTIERAGDMKYLRLRDERIPVISMQSVLGIDDRAAKSLNPHVVVLSRREGPFGVIVDVLGATEEVVVKPLSPALRHPRLFSGNAILSDGAVVMILDVSRIATAAAGYIEAAGGAA